MTTLAWNKFRDFFKSDDANIDVIMECIKRSPKLSTMINTYHGDYAYSADFSGTSYSPKSDISNETIQFGPGYKTITSAIHELVHATGKYQAFANSYDSAEKNYDTATAYAQAMLIGEGEAYYWERKIILELNSIADAMIAELNGSVGDQLTDEERFDRLVALNNLKADLNSELKETDLIVWENGKLSAEKSVARWNEFKALIDSVDSTASDEAHLSVFKDIAKIVQVMVGSGRELDNVSAPHFTYDERFKINHLLDNTDIIQDFQEIAVRNESIFNKPFLVKTLTNEQNNADDARFLGDQNTNDLKDTLTNTHAGGTALAQHSGQGDLLYGGKGEDTLYGNSGKDILLGGGGSDHLYGKEGEDVLGGNAGDDHLYGGKGSDQLHGGTGFDTYHIEDQDTVIDTDMSGKVMFGDHVLGKFILQSPGETDAQKKVWISVDDAGKADNLFTARRDGKALLVKQNGTDHEARIENFFEGATAGNDLGIGFRSSPAAQSQSGLGITVSDESRAEAPGDAAEEGVAGFERFHNFFYMGGKSYVLHSGPKNDVVFAQGVQVGPSGFALRARLGEGDDVIYGSRQRDWIEGGDGTDVINGGLVVDNRPQTEKDADWDFLVGNDGGDFIHGMAGDDTIHTGNLGEHESTTAQDKQGDWATGGEGTDTIYGSSGKDFLQGGEGTDVIHGGAHDDLILGDAYIRPDVAFTRWGIPGGAPNIYEHRVDAEGKWRTHGISMSNVLPLNQKTWDWTLNADKLDYTVTRKQGHLAVDQHLVAEGGDDYLYGGSGNDFMVGQTGNDVLNGEEGNDILFGDDNSNPDVAGNDTLLGGGGNDSLYGGKGNDSLIGGTGRDELYGGEGSDRYYFYRDDMQEAGEDVIHDDGRGENGIRDMIVLDNRHIAALAWTFDADRNLWNSAEGWQITREGETLIIRRDNGNAAIKVMDYANGDFGLTLPDAQPQDPKPEDPKPENPQNPQPPSSGAPLAAQSIDEKQALSFTVPDNAFQSGKDDPLSYSAQLADGKPLPAWLTFDSASRTFSGTPGNDDVGTLNIELSAKGKGGSASQRFTLNILNVNDAPQAGEALADVQAERGKLLSHALPANAFVDIDKGDSLTLSATLENGDALPIWLNFDAEQARFAGTPPADAQAAYRIVLTATDKAGESVSQNFALTIHSAPQVGTENHDKIWGKATNDRIDGGAGNDKIYGGEGDDEINGGADNDALWGNAGNDILRGGEGDDYLSGEDGDDILEGGAGNDLLSAGKGNDIYRFSGDFGRDTVRNLQGKDDGGGHDALEFTDLRLEDIIFEKDGFSTLVIRNRKNSASVSVNNYFLNDGKSPYHIDEIRLADGHTLDYAAVKAKAYQSTDGDDLVWGDDGDNTLHGGLGDDTLHGGDGNDQLQGDSGNDKLFGYSGNDRLIGGQGNDYMIGGAGNDTYHFARDFGRDFINNHDSSAGRHDRIAFSELNLADLDIRRESNNLILRDKNGNGQITVKNHFVNGWHIDDIRFADGTTLDYDTINRLVQGAGNTTRSAFRRVDSTSVQQAQQMAQAMASFDSAQPLDALAVPEIRQPLLAVHNG